MQKTKIASLLFISVLAFCSISFIEAAQAAGAFDPFASPTPTASPAPTPLPTPKPEPKLWPNLDIKIVSSASSATPKIQVSGTLTYNKTAISDAQIYVGYSADQGVNWKNFSLVQTRSDGSYVAVWIPNATGNYIVNAHWEGNSTLHWLDASAHLALTVDSFGNAFSVVSNSSIQKFSYDQKTQVLHFEVNGTQDADAYAYVSIPKSQLGDTHVLQIKIDGQPLQFTTESQEETWVVACMFLDGEHSLTVQIPEVDTIMSENTPWTPIIAVAAVIALIAVVAVVLAVRRRRRIAATVAAILKENRPSY